MPKKWVSPTGTASQTCAVVPTRRAPVREARSRSPVLGQRAGPGPTPNTDELFPTPPVRRAPHLSESESDSDDDTITLTDSSDSADVEEIPGPEPNAQTTTDSSTASETESDTEDSSSEPEPEETDASITGGPTAPQTDTFDVHRDEDWHNADYDADSEAPGDAELGPSLASGTGVVARPRVSTELAWTGD